jgi:transposase
VHAYELVRRAVIVGGTSLRAAAREFGINRRTITKIVESPVPAGYRVAGSRIKPKLGGFLQAIERILAEDGSAPPKQRHTAKRIYERLRDELGYAGSYQQVRVYVAQLKSRPKECFVPLVSVPGEAEADFFEAVAIIDGLRWRTHVFLHDLPFSDVWFARAYPSENAESFADGHAAAFAFVGGVPRSIVYDNPSYAVKREPGGLKGRERTLTQSFAELCSAFLFEPVFANVASGNEKGSVERKVCSVRSRAFVPLPHAASFEELNEKLFAMALADKEKAERFAEDAAHLLPLTDYKPSRLVSVKADKLALVRFDRSSYSVPSGLCRQRLLVRATPFVVEILDKERVVATHPRSHQPGGTVTVIAHYVDVLEHKPRAARSALPVIQAGLPDEFEAYRRRVEDRTADGDRRFVAVLRLVTLHGPARVAEALRLASSKQVLDPAAIGLLCMKHEDLPARASHALRDGLTAPCVKRPPLSEYARLLAGGPR